MTLAIGLTLAVLICVVAGLTLTALSPDLILVGGLLVLMVSGVVGPEDALSGFSNEGVATIGALFIVADGMRRTGGIGRAGAWLLGAPKTIARAQLRLMAPVAGLSALLNNTPVVAMMMPVVNDWARRRGLSVSQLLIPLSYASIFGGLLTLIGTSTTLVVNGLLLDTAGQRGFSMFELAQVGLPVTLVGVVYILVATRWLLPERKPARQQLDNPREYMVEMVVERGSPVVGRSIEAAGLRHLPGMFLSELLRGTELSAAVAPTTVIQAGDRLTFVGIVESVIDLQKIPGLVLASDSRREPAGLRSKRSLLEAVIGRDSRLVGVTVREARFRSHYNAVIVAIARQGARIDRKIGEIRLEAGDTLLLEAAPTFVEDYRSSRDFILLGAIDGWSPVAHERAPIARGILVLMVVAASTGLLSMLEASCLAAAAMVMSGCIPSGQATRAIDWGVLLGIGAGLGIGAAVSSSGTAPLAAAAVLDIAYDSPYAALALVYGMTTVLANLITTKAAAALMFPIALATAEHLGVSFMPFAVVLTVAAASAYATPIGYQTNLMVYGPGGYRGADFLRVGGPLSVVVGIVTILVVPQMWPL